MKSYKPDWEIPYRLLHVLWPFPVLYGWLRVKPLLEIFSFFLIFGVYGHKSLKSLEKFNEGSDDCQKQEYDEKPGFRVELFIQIAPDKKTYEDGSGHDETEASEHGESPVCLCKPFPFQNCPLLAPIFFLNALVAPRKLHWNLRDRLRGIEERM